MANIYHEEKNIYDWFKLAWPAFSMGMNDKARRRWNGDTVTPNDQNYYEAGRQFRSMHPHITTKELQRCLLTKRWSRSVVTAVNSWLDQWNGIGTMAK